MSEVTFLKSIPFSVCKSNFLIGLTDLSSLPQQQELHNFVKQHNIVDMCMTKTTQQHCAVGLIINHQYCSLEALKSKIVESSGHARQYFYLAINKFYVYSTVDLPETPNIDYDTQLVNYCCGEIKHEFELIKHTVRNDDKGTLGNFLHPVTTMFFKRYE
jgi:hypothetical protein